VANAYDGFCARSSLQAGGIRTSSEVWVTRVWETVTLQDLYFVVCKVAVGLFHGWFFLEWVREWVRSRKAGTESEFWGRFLTWIQVGIQGCVAECMLHEMHAVSIHVEHLKFQFLDFVGTCMNAISSRSLSVCALDFFYCLNALQFFALPSLSFHLPQTPPPTLPSFSTHVWTGMIFPFASFASSSWVCTFIFPPSFGSYSLTVVVFGIKCTALNISTLFSI